MVFLFWMKSFVESLQASSIVVFDSLRSKQKDLLGALKEMNIFQDHGDAF